MSTYLITYDLKSPGQRYTDVLNYIKAFPGWARLSESSYAVTSYVKTPAIIRDELKAIMDANDHVVVIALALPWAGWASKDVNDWLSSNIAA